MKGRVLVLMSGGVDSSVSAALLKERGYECVGAHLKLWSDPKADQTKAKIAAQNLAESICNKLGIPFHLIDLTQEFKTNVVDYFTNQLIAGETPNPCIRCNKSIKFGALFDTMKKLGCEYLATGHYAKIVRKPNGTVEMHKGEDSTKDQSYFLYNLNQEKLKHLILPIGEFTKPQVRELAKKFNLTQIENTKESQDVCFYPEKTVTPFLKRHLKANRDFKPGNTQTSDGKIIGRHDGLPFYTIGQRRGIAIGGTENPLYVNKTDKLSNTLIVGSEEELYSSEVNIIEANFLSGKEPKDGEEFDIKIRSHCQPAKGKIHSTGSNTFKIQFQKPQRAITAGQSLVLYEKNILIGGGVMTQV